jgi:hypothetical protein
MLMVESICGQSFAYAREMEKDRKKRLVKLGQKEARQQAARRLNKIHPSARLI